MHGVLIMLQSCCQLNFGSKKRQTKERKRFREREKNKTGGYHVVANLSNVTLLLI